MAVQRLDILIGAKDTTGAALSSVDKRFMILNDRLKMSFGRGSALKEFSELLVGGGAIAGVSILGRIMANVTEKAVELQAAMAQGKIDAAGMVDELGRSIPILGGVYQAVQNIEELFTGTRAREAEILKHAQERLAIAERERKTMLDLKDRIEKFERERASRARQREIDQMTDPFDQERMRVVGSAADRSDEIEKVFARLISASSDPNVRRQLMAQRFNELGENQDNMIEELAQIEKDRMHAILVKPVEDRMLERRRLEQQDLEENRRLAKDIQESILTPFEVGLREIAKVTALLNSELLTKDEADRAREQIRDRLLGIGTPVSADAAKERSPFQFALPDLVEGRLLSGAAQAARGRASRERIQTEPNKAEEDTAKNTKELTKKVDDLNKTIGGLPLLRVFTKV